NAGNLPFRSNGITVQQVWQLRCTCRSIRRTVTHIINSAEAASVTFTVSKLTLPDGVVAAESATPASRARRWKDLGENAFSTVVSSIGFELARLLAQIRAFSRRPTLVPLFEKVIG